MHDKNQIMRTFIVILLLALCHITTISAQPKQEIRATWLTTLGGLDFPSQKATSAEGILRQKRELCRLLDRLKQANFNTILLQTRLRGDVIYPSAIEGFAESLTGHTGRNPGYDLLSFAIDECHKRGMELHAWLVAIPAGNARQVRLQGKNSVVKKHPKLCKLYKGNWYLDPGNPGTEDYLAGIVREIVSRYDVDGIHLDYIRYPDHPETFPDKDSFRKYGKGKNLAAWRRENITRIVRRVYTETKRQKPWIKVSSSPVGKYNDTSRYASHGWNAYRTVHQDAQRWLEEGIQDALFPMMYFKGNNFYPFALDWQEHKQGRWIVPGLGIYFLHPKEQNWTLDEIVRQMNFLRHNGLDGQAFFRNRFLLENTKDVLSELTERFYMYPAVVPPMAWEDSIPPAPPTAPTLIRKGREVYLSWQPSGNAEAEKVYYRIYASNRYPVNTEQAANLVETRTDSTAYVFSPSAPWQQRVYWAVTAVDRFGNESRPASFNRPQDNSLQIFDGKLPEIPKGAVFIVSDATEQEITRLPSTAKELPPTLGSGFFRISLLTADGQIKPLGIFMR